MYYSAYSVLSSEQKERIRAFVGFCNARDHLHNEIYLGSEFKAYPEMKVFYLAQEGSEIVGFLQMTGSLLRFLHVCFRPGGGKGSSRRCFSRQEWN